MNETELIFSFVFHYVKAIKQAMLEGISQRLRSLNCEQTFQYEKSWDKFLSFVVQRICTEKFVEHSPPTKIIISPATLIDRTSTNHGQSWNSARISRREQSDFSLVALSTRLCSTLKKSFSDQRKSFDVPLNSFLSWIWQSWTTCWFISTKTNQNFPLKDVRHFLFFSTFVFKLDSKVKIDVTRQFHHE